MNATLVLWIKALSAFCVPLLAGFGGMFALYVTTGLPEHWKIVLAATSCSALVAAISGLSSFLSRTFADHQDAKEVDAGTPQIVPAKVTAVAEPPISSPASPSQP